MSDFGFHEKQITEALRLGNHDAPSVFLRWPRFGVIFTIKHEINFASFAMQQYAIAFPDFLPGQIEQRFRHRLLAYSPNPKRAVSLRERFDAVALAGQGITEELRQPDTVHLVVGYRDHRIVGGEFRELAGIDSVDFQKI